MSVLFSFFIWALKHVFFLVGYLANSNSFPQPLNAEEEADYLEQYRNGNMEARNILIEKNLRLVAHVAKKYNSLGKENDDMISIGTIGLIKAITTFDSTKGIRLATYAARCIENEILMNIRSTKKLQNELSLQESIGVDKEGNEMTLSNIICDDQRDIAEEVEIKILIKKMYEKIKSVLKNREKSVIELRYGLANGTSKTQKEIGSMLGISRSYVSRIEKKAIKRLCDEIKDEI